MGFPSLSSSFSSLCHLWILWKFIHSDSDSYSISISGYRPGRCQNDTGYHFILFAATDFLHKKKPEKKERKWITSRIVGLHVQCEWRIDGRRREISLSFNRSSLDRKKGWSIDCCSSNRSDNQREWWVRLFLPSLNLISSFSVHSCLKGECLSMEGAVSVQLVAETWISTKSGTLNFNQV